jgi:alkylated DNA repair dioxygenase AlkB
MNPLQKDTLSSATRMDLFPTDPNLNLLPCDGIVHYHGRILSLSEADQYTAALMSEVPWQHDEAVIYGKHIITARKVAWYGDAQFAYAYSGITRQALPWNDKLLQIKTIVEQHSGARFNSCLLNLYEHGDQGMAWHSDDEKSLGRNTAIASVSFGAERRFCFKHKRSSETAEIVLEHGSLLIMKGTTQTHWLHSIPKAKRITQPRINLTFRTIVGQDKKA